MPLGDQAHEQRALAILRGNGAEDVHVHELPGSRDPAGNPLTGAPATQFWMAFAGGLGQTLLDASVGFVVGTTVAIAVAVLFVAVPALGRAVMPFAIVTRSGRTPPRKMALRL